jgi:hypothetical protein
MVRNGIRGAVVALGVAVALAAGPASAVSYTNLYSFTGGADGGTPFGAVVFDKTGALYATTGLGGSDGFGTVFEATPPTTGTAWPETVLYSFTGQLLTGAKLPDAYPTGALIFDGTGALYGTSAFTVFKLSPPPAGQSVWGHTRLHDFTLFDGAYPTYGALVFDSKGSLYGSTSSAVVRTDGGEPDGNVYRLTPPAAGQHAWSLTVLHQFGDSDDVHNR